MVIPTEVEVHNTTSARLSQLEVLKQKIRETLTYLDTIQICLGK